MLLSFTNMSGRNYATFDPPFFLGADLKHYFSHNNRTYGPFVSHNAAVQAFQSLLTHQEGRV